MIDKKWLALLGIFIFCFPVLAAQTGISFLKYHSPEEINRVVRQLASDNSAFTSLHELARTPGKRAVLLLEIGPETGKREKSLPAVFVAANLEGTVPIAGEAALYLAKMIVEKPEVRKDLTWYILACSSPDAAARAFAQPLYFSAVNNRLSNNDMDDMSDEDGPDDLDGNGMITMMRVKHPQGEWIPVPGEPRLMKKADPIKGEKGEYKLYTEGLDNDRDGSFNEDGPGGVNLAVNFPHLFKFHTAEGGAWAGSEAESYNLIRFIMQHREIGLIFTFGQTNFCMVPPRGGRQGSADFDKIKIPERFASMMGADTEKTYTMKEIIEMVQPMVPQGMELTEGMVASFLGLGAMVNPLPEDLKFYTEISEKYKEYLKEKKLDGKRLEPAPAKDGSFDLWAYYHLGLPSFSLDFWTLPEPKEEKKDEPEITPEKLESLSNDDFIALGEEKIDAFLKSSGAPAQFKAKQVIAMLKGGQMDTKRMAQMLKQMPKPPSKEGGDPKEKALLAFNNSVLDGKGFVDWKPFEHPGLGQVEIGGAVPYTDGTPPSHMLESLLENQVPWVFEITKKMARIRISDTKIEALGKGVYRIEAWVENSGFIPYPTAMGARNNRILPVIVTLEGEGITYLEGKKRSFIKSIEGHMTGMVTWLVRMEKPGKLKLKALTSTAWNDERILDLGGSR